MKLIYSDSSEEVQINDPVSIRGISYTISHFCKPHKPSSSGKVTVTSIQDNHSNEYYVSVIGAEWIEREDHY